MPYVVERSRLWPGERRNNFKIAEQARMSGNEDHRLDRLGV